MVNQQAVQQGRSVQPVMCDFGAAYCYDRASAGRFWEAMEVRAYGLFMKDLFDRTMSSTTTSSSSCGDRGSEVDPDVGKQLVSMVDRCLAKQAVCRPSFEELERELSLLMQASAVPVVQQ